MNLAKIPVLAATRLSRCLPEAARRPFWRVFALARPLPVARLHGPVRTGGEGTMVIAGKSPEVDYLPGCFFAGEPERMPLRPQGVAGLSRRLLAEAEGVDLVVAHVDQWVASRVDAGAFLRVPHRIAAVLAVPENIRSLAVHRSSLGQDFRLVRNHGFSAQLGTAAGDVAWFYEHLYRPTVEHRHGGLAVLKTLPAVEHAVRLGGLLWIEQHGERVGGIVFRRRGPQVELYAMGQIPAEDGRPRPGCDAASYFHIVETARSLGCVEVDFGGCRPSLDDGGLRYKRKWGMHVAENRGTYHDLLVRWTRVTPAVAGLLDRTSLVFRHDGGFAALLGSSTASPGNRAMPGIGAYFHVRDGAPFGEFLPVGK
jgi:hypothetical protein